MQKILLVDGSNLARRNYHSQNLSNSKGVATGLIYGVINSLISVQGSVKANEVLVVWDEGGSSDWRKKLFPAYKGNRSKPDPEYIQQRKQLQDLLSYMGVKQFSSAITEADDIIGFFAKEFYPKDTSITILSGDKDFYQLISSTVTVMTPSDKVIKLDENGKITFKDSTKEVTIRPDQIVDYKCLVGDSADNISGAPGFGVGAAITYFESNNGLNNIKNGTVKLENMRAKAIEGMMMTIPILDKFESIITINLDKGREAAEAQIELPALNKEKVEALFDFYEFNQFKLRGERVYDIAGVNNGN